MLVASSSRRVCKECDEPIAPGDLVMRATYSVPKVPTGLRQIRVTLCESCAELYQDSQEPTGSRS